MNWSRSIISYLSGVQIRNISTESTVKSVRSNKMLREEIRACHYNNNKVRDSWLESHIMPEKFEPKSSLGSLPRVEAVEVKGEPPPSLRSLRLGGPFNDIKGSKWVKNEVLRNQEAFCKDKSQRILDPGH